MGLRFFDFQINAFLEFSWRMITSALADDDIKQLLTDYLYDLTDLDTGMGLYDEAKRLQKSQKRLHDKQHRIGRKYKELITKVQDDFLQHFNIMLSVFVKERHEMIDMGYIVRDSSKQLDWLQKAKEFYDRLQEDTEFLARIAAKSLTLEKMQLALQKVNEAAAKKVEHMTAKGAAEHEIEVRNKALAALFNWDKGFIKMAGYAFKEKPQFIEKLGITRLTEGYKRKKKEEEPGSEEPVTEEPPVEEPQPVVVPVQPPVGGGQNPGGNQ